MNPSYFFVNTAPKQSSILVQYVSVRMPEAVVRIPEATVSMPEAIQGAAQPEQHSQSTECSLRTLLQPYYAKNFKNLWNTSPDITL